MPTNYPKGGTTPTQRPTTPAGGSKGPAGKTPGTQKQKK